MTDWPVLRIVESFPLSIPLRQAVCYGVCGVCVHNASSIVAHYLVWRSSPHRQPVACAAVQLRSHQSTAAVRVSRNPSSYTNHQDPCNHSSHIGSTASARRTRLCAAPHICNHITLYRIRQCRTANRSCHHIGTHRFTTIHVHSACTSAVQCDRMLYASIFSVRKYRGRDATMPSLRCERC